MLCYSTIADTPKVYSPVGCCIYCGKAEGPLQDEHIVAYGLGGNLVLQKSSCQDCADITSRIEDFCLSRIFGRVRAHLNVRTRRKKKRERKLNQPTPLEIMMPGGGKNWISIPFADHPPVMCMYHFPRPYKPLRIADPPTIQHKAWIKGFDRNSIEEPEKFGGIGYKAGESSPMLLAQMLAKIAHSYAVAEMGLNTFTPLLQDFILGKRLRLNEFVGGNMNETPPLPIRNALNIRRVIEVDGREYIAVDIRLFADQGAPEYYVLAGETGSVLTRW